MTLPKIQSIPDGETIDGRKMFSYGALYQFAREYGQTCFEAGRASVNPPIKPADSEVVNDLMGMMGIRK